MGTLVYKIVTVIRNTFDASEMCILLLSPILNIDFRSQVAGSNKESVFEFVYITSGLAGVSFRRGVCFYTWSRPALISTYEINTAKSTSPNLFNFGRMKATSIRVSITEKDVRTGSRSADKLGTWAIIDMHVPGHHGTVLPASCQTTSDRKDRAELIQWSMHLYLDATLS